MYDLGYESYQQTQIVAKAASSSPAELVIMLLDGLIDELDRISGHLDAKNYLQKSQSVKKCMRILSGLSVALDLENGGQLASNLNQLYEYCGRQLMRASIRNDISELANIRKIINELRDGWMGFAERNR